MRSARSLRYCMNTVIRDSINSAQMLLQSNAEVENKLSQLTYLRLLEMVKEANEVCSLLLPERGYLFALPSNKQRSVFWRLTAEVFCRFMDRAGTFSVRVLSLRDFVVLHGELLRAKDLHETRVQLSSQPTYNTTAESDLCCICLDRVPDVVLPCLHIFCRTCIQNWNGRTYQLPGGNVSTDLSDCALPQNRSQCPLCRERFEDTSSAWQVVDLPSREELREEVPRHVRKLIAQSGRLTTNFPSEFISGPLISPDETTSIA